MTPPEVALWVRLRARQPGSPRFRRQHPIGPYILDFYCASAKLAIEVDGLAHDTAGRPERDRKRDAYLARAGITVLRVAAADVMRDPNEVANGIVLAADRPPQSSTFGR